MSWHLVADVLLLWFDVSLAVILWFCGVAERLDEHGEPLVVGRDGDEWTQ